MDLLDLLIQGYQNDAAQTNPALPPPAAAATETSVANPAAETLNGPVATQAPQGLDSLPALALLKFAAQISQPKARGQSSVGKFMESAAGATGYYMNEKKQIEDRAMERTMQQQKIAKTNLDLEAAKEGLQDARARRPLELERLKLAIDNAKTEQEINGLKIRSAKIAEKYAEQMAQADLAGKQAKTVSERASAALRYQQAELAKKEAEEYVKVAEMRWRERALPKYKPLEASMPGDPERILDERTGQVYLAPMMPAQALEAARAQVAAEKEVQPSIDTRARERFWYDRFQKGTVPKPGTEQAPSGAAPAKPGEASAASPAPATSAAATPTVSPKLAAAIAASKQDPTGLYAEQEGGVTHYYIGGREVSKDEGMRRLKKAQASGPPTPTIPRPGALATAPVTAWSNLSK